MKPRVLLVAVGLVLLGPGPSHALYLDPGTGSIVLQAVIGAVAGGWLLFRTKIAGFVDWLSSRGGTPPEESTPSDDS